MVSKRRVKERYAAYMKVLKHNWILFKASKTGIVGIAIMIFFIILAVSAPYMNLRDPIRWVAPDEDLIQVDRYWYIDTNQSYPEITEEIPITLPISFRVSPAAQEPRADRIYMVLGNRIYAIKPGGRPERVGAKDWFDPLTQSGTYFRSNGTISTPIVPINFGDHQVPTDADYVLYFGTSTGNLYALNDSRFSPSEVPHGEDVFVEYLGSPITSVAAYSADINTGRVGSIRMSQGVGGSAYDLDGLASPYVLNPDVLGLGAKEYRMYYSGLKEGKWRVLSALSEDGGLNWGKLREEPQGEQNVRISLRDELDSEGARDPFVYRLPDGNYTMFYSGTDGERWRILEAYSGNGLTWFYRGVAIDMNPFNASDPFYLKIGDTEVLYFTVWNDTYSAIYSANYSGGVWTDIVPRVTGEGNFTGKVGEPEIMKMPDGTYRMWYSERDYTENSTSPILTATSQDGFTWTSEEVVINPGFRIAVDKIAISLHSPTVTVLKSGGYRIQFVAFDGTISHVVSFASVDALTWIREDRDIFVAATADGTLYAYSAIDNSRLWSVPLTSVPIRVMGTPLHDPSDPIYSPAFTPDGTKVYVGSQDGKIFAIRTRDAAPAWYDDAGNPYVFDLQTDKPWYTAPVVSLLDMIPKDGGVYTSAVYAASGDGWLYALYSENGTVLPAWQGYERPGILVKKTSILPDGGNLTAPSVHKSVIYVGSDSGYLYAIRRDPVGNIEAGEPLWRFEDRILTERGFRWIAPPVPVPKIRLVYAVGYSTNLTEDPSDDVSTVFSLKEDGNYSWRMSFQGQILSHLNIWRDEEGSGHLHESVWFGTSKGVIYSYSSTGTFIAPLPPTWLQPSKTGNTYLLGTDARGRDIFSQFVWGSQIALIVGFLSAFFSISIGVLIGLVSGYSGGKVDVVLMRFTDVILVLPGLPLVIILAAVLGASIWNIILVISIVGWPGVARVIRAEDLSLKERPFIDSARVTGASNIRIMFKHVAPNVLPLAFLYMTFAVSGAILTEAALSFLGLGDVNTPSWGQMLEAIQRSNVLEAWWWLLPPGLGITMLSLSFYLVGNAFEQIVNPRLRKR